MNISLSDLCSLNLVRITCIIDFNDTSGVLHDELPLFRNLIYIVYVHV